MRTRFLALPAVAAVGLASAVPASAQVNYGDLTASADWSTAITALVTVGAAFALILVARKGIRFVLGMMR